MDLYVIIHWEQNKQKLKITVKKPLKFGETIAICPFFGRNSPTNDMLLRQWPYNDPTSLPNLSATIHAISVACVYMRSPNGQ